MTAKKTKTKNPAGDFMELLGVDPTKAGLMLGFELGRQLKQNIEVILSTLLGIEAHLLAIRIHYEQEKNEKEAEQTSSATATEGPGPGSDAVPDRG
ncbi:hypothetical protein MUP46_02435 [Patescibacteria group bacterium]|nr:hypothetical protein [Patescibacteria group bacterium]